LIEAPERRVFTDWDEQTLERLHTKISTRAREYRERGQDPPAVLMVLDDSTGLQRSLGRMGALDKIYALDRKNNFSVANLSQRYHAQLSPTVRLNATHTSLLRTSTAQELTDFIKDQRPPDISHQQMMSMYNTAVNAGLGSFLHISRFSPVGSRFSIGFDRVFAQ
jgi:hypothetical protein